VIGHQWDIDKVIDMEYGISISDMMYRYGYLPYRYGHPGYRYGKWANDMRDYSINTVICHIDMGYLVTRSTSPCLGRDLHASHHPLVQKVRQQREV